MTFSNLLPAVAAWLATYAVHSTLLLGAAWLLARRSPAAWGEMLWKAALLGALVTATLPRLLPAPAAMVPDALESTAAVAPLASETVSATTPSVVAPFVLSWLAAAWLTAAAVFLLTLAVSSHRLRRRLAGRRSLDGTPLASALDELRAAAGLRRRVRLSVSDRLAVPVALGILRPEICLPQRALDELGEAELRAALGHELAHLARRDPLWRLLARTVEGVFFFQPLNALAARRLRQLSELLADDWATRRAVSGRSLARCLATVARWTVGAPRLGTAVPCMTDGGPELEHRVRRLLDGASGGRMPRGAAAAMVAAVLAMGFYAPTWSAAPPEKGEQTQEKKAKDEKAEDERISEEEAAKRDAIRAAERAERERARALRHEERETRRELRQEEREMRREAERIADEHRQRAEELRRLAEEQRLNAHEEMDRARAQVDQARAELKAEKEKLKAEKEKLKAEKEKLKAEKEKAKEKAGKEKGDGDP